MFVFTKVNIENFHKHCLVGLIAEYPVFEGFGKKEADYVINKRRKNIEECRWFVIMRGLKNCSPPKNKKLPQATSFS